MADASLELDDARVSEPAGPAAARSGWMTSVMWAAAGALAAALVFGLVLLARTSSSATAAVVRSQVVFTGRPLRFVGTHAFALKPDASEIVFTSTRADGGFQLFRRRLSEDEATPVAGTEGAAEPFFSSDGQWLAFAQNGRLRRMPAAGGAATEVAEVTGFQGGSFAPDGSIVFNAQHGEGLLRVAVGGTPTAVTKVDVAAGQAGHHWPHVLPGGTHVIYTEELDGKSYSDAQIVIVALDGSDRRVLIASGSDARYVPSGHVIYWHDGSLWAVPFDPASRQLTGSAAVVVRDLMLGEANGQAHYSVAADGTMVYLTGRDTQQERGLMLVDRSGAALPATAERRAFETPSVAPDGRRIAVTVTAANDSLWLLDVERRSLTRITYEAENAFPVWSPDATRVALGRHRGGEHRQLFVMPSDGGTAPALLHSSSRHEAPQSWTGNGDVLAYTRTEGSGDDIWVAGMSGESKPRPFLATRFFEADPRFSPDGRWIAYASDESGRMEIYVRPYPGPGQKQLVSSDGGRDPRWRGDGRELFYRQVDTIMAADVVHGAGLTVSLPRVLFKVPQVTSEFKWSPWDVFPDGKRFVMIQDFAQPRTAVTLVQNWFTELKGKFASRP